MSPGVEFQASMIFELNKEYKINKAKRTILKVSAIILFVGTLVSVATSLILRSVLPFLGGIYLAGVGYALLVKASQTMLINSEGILLKSRSSECLLPWLDFGEITQGRDINRHRVSFTRLSDPPSRGINLGLCRLQLLEDNYLPSTFGMRAKELAADLEQIRKEKIQQEH